MSEILVKTNYSIDDFKLSVDQEISTEGITCLVGSSGVGKSTLLRFIAGLNSFTGLVKIGEQLWLDSNQNIKRPTHRRSLGFVFY